MLVRTWGCKGHRPVVDRWDNKNLVCAFASVNCNTGPQPIRTHSSAT